MLYDQVIRGAPVQHSFQVLQPFLLKVGVHRIHHGDFFIQNHIGIVGHPVLYGVLSLKEVDVMVVYAYVANVICDLHCGVSFLNIIYSQCPPAQFMPLAITALQAVSACQFI